jgi:ankyrin repeat protein
MVSTLLTKDRIAAADDDGHAPLHIAILNAAPAGMIRIIIDQGGRISAIDSGGRTPLRMAVDKANWEAVRMLAEAGSDPFSTAGDGKTPAELVIASGQTGVRALFSGRAINARDRAGNTVLHYAAKTGDPDMVTLLLSLGANKSVKNFAAESPADIAQRWNRRDLAALLNS